MPTVIKAGGGVSKNKLVTANTQAANVKENTRFVDKDGNVQNGTMPDRGAIAANVSANQSYTVPAGYHNGNGTVTGPTLNGDADAGDVLTGKKFYKDSATQQTGTMPNRGAVTASVTANSSYTIQAGYHNGSGKVNGPTLNGDAVVGNVLTGKRFYKDSATQLTGTMANNGAVSPGALAPGGSYTIPAGYHNGSGKVTAKTPNNVYNRVEGTWEDAKQQSLSTTAGAWYVIVLHSAYGDIGITCTGLESMNSYNRTTPGTKDDGYTIATQGSLWVFIGKASGTSVGFDCGNYRSFWECTYYINRIG